MSKLSANEIKRLVQTALSLTERVPAGYERLAGLESAGLAGTAGLRSAGLAGLGNVRSAGADSVTSMVKSAVISKVVGFLMIISAIALLVWGGYALFRKYFQAPAGGTFADKAVAKTVHRGSMWHQATKVVDIKNCKEDYENKNGNGLAFWSAEGDACYTCPPGNLVNAFGDMKKNKCTDPNKTIFDPTRDSAAIFQRKGLGPDGLTPLPTNPPGVFRDGMAYWVCPNKTTHTGSRNDKPVCLGQCENLYPAIPSYTQGSSESNEDFEARIKNTYGSDVESTPPAGYQLAFQDALSGECYSCPEGFNRSAAPVTATNACSQ